MKFDMLCKIILEGKKSEQVIRVGVANAAPSFSIDDVLRDASDPSKGVRTYMDERMEGVDTGEQIDPETLARRVLRRINWVAKTVIKRIGSREVNIRKLHQSIMTILEQYLKVVARKTDDEIAEMKMKIAKEASFIGNLMLPPTDRFPKAKGVFTIVADQLGKEATPAERKKGKDGKTVAERISNEFNMSVDDFIAAFDPDLMSTIKEIIRTGAIRKPKAEVAPEGDTAEVPGEELAQESVEPGDGVTLDDILKDPRIKGVYDSRIVRKMVKSMIDVGSVSVNAEGKLMVPEKGTEEWRGKYEKYREEKDLSAIEEFPAEDDIAALPTEEEPEVPEVEAEDEEDVQVDTEDEQSAQRLGYKKPSRDAEVAGGDDIDEEPSEEDEAKKWYK